MASFTTQALDRLHALGLALPANPPAPAGAYVAFRLDRGFGTLAAQVPGYGPDALTGRVGHELTPEQGILAAQRAALNGLGRLHEALGGFDHLRGLMHVAGHVASAELFWEQPRILDGASRLFDAVLHERGQHTRTAFPARRLPHNVSIELAISFTYDE